MKHTKPPREAQTPDPHATGPDPAEALCQSEQSYRNLFNAIRLALYIQDPEGRFIEVNDGACAMYGYTREEFIGRTPEFLAAPGLNDFASLTEKIRLALGGEPQHLEFWGRRKNGEIFPKDVHLTHGTYAGKAVLIAVAADISEQKRSEHAFREREELFREVFNHANDAVFLHEMTPTGPGKYLLVNDVAVTWLGYSREELLKMSPRDIIPEELGQRIVPEIMKTIQKRGYATFESAHRRKDGSMYPVEVSTHVFTLGKKKVALSIARDITQRKMVQDALVASEERYRTLIDHLPDYVIVHRDGILFYVNPAAAKKLGYTSDNLIGKPILSFIAPESREKILAAVHQRMAGKDLPPYEMKILARDGTYHTVLVHGAMIQYDGGPASLNVLTDVTPLKEAEASILRVNEDLEKRVAERTEALSRSNEQLTAEISARIRAEQEITRSLEEKDLLLREIHHRVKNNLQIIASLLKLQSRYITDPNVLDSIKESQSRVRAMALVHERIYRSHNISEINLSDYLNYLTRQILQFYNIQQNQIGITVSMDDIMADIDTITPLGLIMNELVSNSLKHAFPGGRTGTISIGCTRKGSDTLHLVYHDNGVGMPAGFNWRTTESLGLRLVNSLVDQLDGTIDLDGGDGTTFVIEIRQKSPVTLVKG
jgi:PAS domain S-box-containing protein